MKSVAQTFATFYSNLAESTARKCPYSELFRSAFSRIRTECGEILRISLYSARMRKNTDQDNSEYGHFLRSDLFLRIFRILLTNLQKIELNDNFDNNSNFDSNSFDNKSNFDNRKEGFRNFDISKATGIDKISGRLLKDSANILAKTIAVISKAFDTTNH